MNSYQGHPFEVMSNYGGVASARCNLDVQDLRRVLPEELWMEDDAVLPHLGDKPEWGYMGRYEWDGERHLPLFPAK